MRKRKYVVGVAGALVVSLAVAGLASADFLLQSQTVSVTPTSGKQDKKTAGPVSSLKVAVDTQYNTAGGFAPGGANQKATRTRVDFDKDYSFTPGTVPQCDSATLAGTTTAQALTACGSSQVGAGNSNIIGPIAAPPGVVTAFNGVPVGGLPVILLHNRIDALASTTVLVGTLGTGDSGNPAFGKMLDVTVPILAGGFVITHFETTIPQKQTVKGKKGKKNKKTGKTGKSKPAKFYVMAKCSDKNWEFGARSTYNNGATTTASAVAACSQKKAKKKKK